MYIAQVRAASGTVLYCGFHVVDGNASQIAGRCCVYQFFSFYVEGKALNQAKTYLLHVRLMFQEHTTTGNASSKTKSKTKCLGPID